MRFLKSLSLIFALPALVFANGPISAAAPQSMPTILPAGATIPTPVADKNAAKIYCASPNFDFHNVDEGGDIVHLFHIVNKGKSKLLITNVSTSCGCTAAVEDKKEIAPGGKGTIKATYHTKGRPGHATKIITVACNDPVNPNYQLKLDMTVVREVDIQPEKIYLYNVPHGQSQTSTVKLLGKPNVAFKVLSVDAQNKTVTVTSVEPVVDAATKRKGATITISVPADHVIGNFTDTLKVMTNNKKHAEIDIDVYGEVVGKFTYAPHSVFFAQHQTNPMTVSFNAQEPKTFVVRKVESLKHLARPSVKKINYGNGVEQYQVIIDPAKSLPKDSDGKDTILITTNDKEQSEVTVDVQMTK
jgi:hypothetical protein